MNSGRYAFAASVVVMPLIRSSEINLAFADAPFSSVFHDDVKPELYRLFQVAVFVSTVRLLEEKWADKTINEFEMAFIDEWHSSTSTSRCLTARQ